MKKQTKSIIFGIIVTIVGIIYSYLIIVINQQEYSDPNTWIMIGTAIFIISITWISILRGDKDTQDGEDIKTWEDDWKDFKGLNMFGKRMINNQRKTIEKILNKIDLPKDSKIIDVGCGSGGTLLMFRSLGFKNSIGIDISESGLKICEEKGLKINKDVFLKDIYKEDNKFDLVFSSGLLEHFKDIDPLVEKMCSLSDYVFLNQPNNFSPFGRLLTLLGRRYIHDYAYTVEDFKNSFNKFGFELKIIEDFNLNEHWGLLFKVRP